MSEEASSMQEDTLPLRVASIFVILVGALAGGLPPLFLSAFQSEDRPLVRLIKAFSAGIILTLALVHIIPDAVTDMSQLPVDYPVAGVCVLVGVLSLVVVENALQPFFAHRHEKHGKGGAAGAGSIDDISSHSSAAAPAAVPHGAPADPAASGKAGGGPHAPHAPHAHPAKHRDLLAIQMESGVLGAPAPHDEPDAPHEHSCMRSTSPATWVRSGEHPVTTLRQQAVVFVMEVGCIFHSVVIGVSLGVILDSIQQTRQLLIALVFHQFLEGLSLGCMVASAQFGPCKGLVMILMYALTTPLGVAVGIAVSSTYQEGSITSLAVQGSLNGLSGGMLLYVALISLIAEEFTRSDLRGATKTSLRLWMYVALLLGAASMCTLAVWA